MFRNSTTVFLLWILPWVRLTSAAAFLSRELQLRVPRTAWNKSKQGLNSQYAHFDDPALSDSEGDTTEIEIHLHRPKGCATKKSQIREIRSRQLAGVFNSNSAEDGSDNDDIVIHFQDDQNLVAVTGETASGKSLLVARVVELLTGSKAATTFLAPGQTSATVEIELSLADPFLSAAKSAFPKLGLDPSSLLSNDLDSPKTTGKLVLSRTLLVQPLSLQANSKSRLKSVCQINGQAVTLKVLATLASPLLAVVDAATAATALSKPASRTAILDTAVPAEHLTRVADTRRHYRHCRKQREKLDNELASRTLPKSFTASDDESDLELLFHWIEELDAFETRISAFCRSVATDEHDTALSRIGHKLSTTSWRDNEAPPPSFVSSMYTLLADFRGELQSLEDQIVATRNAVDALGALSSTSSAVTAVERARKFLLDVAAADGDTMAAAERSHELLNYVETALNACTKFLENDDRGLLSILEKSRATCILSVESIDEIVFDWKSLSRKHGIAPATLPSCHMALRSERDGNVEARTLLPKAISAEREALMHFQDACSILTAERQKVAALLADSVTRRLPSLGMGDSVFRVDLITDTSDTTSSNTNLGLDTAEFLLLHNNNSSDQNNNRGGKVNEVASSGEKARILLAIECALPGSIGAACSNSAIEEDVWGGLPPICVIYDEIDAHVGGRAAVSLANLLVDQSRSSQVVAITHSPSVAAAADMHVVIQKATAVSTNGGGGGSSTTSVTARVVDERERRQELARMASGDLAVKEAEVFADALIRDGLQRRNRG
jgi:DNA repair ATPase RecN